MARKVAEKRKLDRAITDGAATVRAVPDRVVSDPALKADERPSSAPSPSPPSSAAPSPDAHLTRFVGYDLKRLFTLVHNDLARVLDQFNLRIISFSVLSVVVRNPGINQTKLAEALNLERSNLVQIIDELSSRSLLTRTPLENNRRSLALVPTEQG